MNIQPILTASPAIQIHLAAAVLALIFGTIMWLRPKGTPSHKLIGRGFMVLMFIAAISAIFIRENGGKFSWIHLFVPLTLAGIVLSLWQIKNRNIKNMWGPYRGYFLARLFCRAYLHLYRDVDCSQFSLAAN